MKRRFIAHAGHSGRTFDRRSVVILYVILYYILLQLIVLCPSIAIILITSTVVYEELSARFTDYGDTKEGLLILKWDRFKIVFSSHCLLYGV